jgi:hypothetical protein
MHSKASKKGGTPRDSGVIDLYTHPDQTKTQLEIQSREFQFIDAMPGAGKTEYFVTRAVRLLGQKKPDRSLIYVAPTILLLKEALDRIHKHPAFKPEMAHKITMVATPAKISSGRGLPNGCRSYEEAPSKVINFILGLSDVYKSNTEDSPPLVQLGDLILTTHETFVQVNHKDPTGGDFQHLRDCEVIFDEARHCVIDNKALRDISNEHLVTMSRAFAFHSTAFQPLTNNDPKAWYVYRLTNAPSKSRMKELFGVINWSSIPKSVRDLRRDVATFSDSGRASVFVMANVDTHALMATATRNSRLSAYTMLRPTSLFNHYKEVTLTSAFFKDSQMYHFLKEDGHAFKDLRGSKAPELAQIYVRDRKLRLALNKRLIVGTILKETQSRAQSTYRNNLTSNLLSNGMVIPRHLTEEVLHPILVDPTMSVRDMIAILSSKKTNPVVSNLEIQRILKRYAIPPLWALILEAAKIIDHAHQLGFITKPNAITDFDHLALLVLNVSKSVWGSSRVPYQSVVRALYTKGFLETTNDFAEDFHTVYTDDEEKMLELTPRFWSKQLSKHLFMKSPDVKFVIPKSNRLHGINKYSKLNAFVHLAALNPTPQLIAFYKIILGPEYDIDQDHSIENLVQMLYRTSLRDVNAKSKVLMVVPYKAQAQLLQTKIGCEDFLYINSPKLIQWSSRRRPMNGSMGSARLKSAEKRRLDLDENDKRRLKSMRVSIHRFRNLMTTDPKNPKVKEWEAKIADYESQIQALVQK